MVFIVILLWSVFFTITILTFLLLCPLRFHICLSLYLDSHPWLLFSSFNSSSKCNEFRLGSRLNVNMNMHLLFSFFPRETLYWVSIFTYLLFYVLLGWNMYARIPTVEYLWLGLIDTLLYPYIDFASSYHVLKYDLGKLGITYYIWYIFYITLSLLILRGLQFLFKFIFN